LLTLFSSCSVGDFLSAYFNTYYNASRLFTEAEEEIAGLKTPQKPDTTFLPPYNLQPGTKTKLNSVVEKCSKILFDNPESSLIDNALMMIGKSYSYLNEQQKAERKFIELINGYPESGFVPEAELLLAQTYYRMNDKVRAREVATAIADSTGGDNEGITGKAFLLLGQLSYESQLYAEARRAFGFAAEYSETDEERASAFMRVAQMNVRLGDRQAALDAYEEAEDESSVYTSEYQAIMGQVSILNQLGDYDEALDRLDDLRSNSNFKEFAAEIDLEIANTLRDSGKLEEAVEQYYYVDTAYARTESSARSHNELGYLYETTLGNYDSALAVYVRGRGQSPQAAVTQTMVRRGEYLRKYKTLTTDIARLESLKTLILNPVAPEMAGAEVAGADSQSVGDSTTTAPPKPVLPPIDTVLTGLARNKIQLGDLFYAGLQVNDSAKFWYTRAIEDHPSTPHVPKAIYTLAQIAEEQQAPRSHIDSLYIVLVEDFPETAFADEARRLLGIELKEAAGDTALIMYDEAEAYLRQDSSTAAIDILRTIVRDHPQSTVAPKALYAIGWTYEQVEKRPDSAIVNFKKLIQLYPASSYATVAFARLKDLPPEEVRRIEEGGNVPETPDPEGEETPPTEVPEDIPPDSSAVGPGTEQNE
jgi:TolA-binding protein